MKINANSSIELEDGETFLYEQQNEDNIWRTSILTLPSGAVVTVQRHFSQIGPSILTTDGKPLSTELDRESGKVIPHIL